ncbi:hypothetical protein [Pectobacterium carotovorum]|uniref:Uncharacterized protein n=1 Tax=Pectobacterium carotovorum subsp. carotovorum TaxID=555 RepID=A0AAI9KZ12_PECCC|nr:hypothetical protein [Pectobacterium carotovorum]GKX46081.1 hypothetical protein SOASR016_08330 [Pectobacterium carotovorum subsp. carotovorum]GLV68385.1 hypothetical protein Pcaca03_08290 [Pectobacterium carotovorum subsp. carotovorum]
MEQTATLRIQTDESGNKYIAGVVIGDMTISKLYIKPDDSDEQRRIAALETQVNQLSTQITSIMHAQERQHFKNARDKVISSLSHALDRQFDPKHP